MKMRHPISIALFFLITLFDSCAHQKDDKSKHKLEFITKAERINQNVLSKHIDNLSILEDSIFLSHGKIVLFLTIQADCSGCRRKGYQYVSRINETCKKRIAFTVGTGLNEGFEKRDNGLVGKIYQDEKSAIKQKLNLFHTPSLVLIDRGGEVNKVLSIYPYEDVEGYNEAEKFEEFLKAVTAL